MDHHLFLAHPVHYLDTAAKRTTGAGADYRGGSRVDRGQSNYLRQVGERQAKATPSILSALSKHYPSKGSSEGSGPYPARTGTYHDATSRGAAQVQSRIRTLLVGVETD